MRWSDALRANAASRDFTVNALMLDPFGLLVHDYTGGVRDCAKRVLRTIGSPTESFQLDPARMLRAARHAARCGEGCSITAPACHQQQKPSTDSDTWGAETCGCSRPAARLAWRHMLQMAVSLPYMRLL